MEIFRLPAVGYDNLVRIIKAYYINSQNNKENDYSYKSISDLSGVHRDTITKNSYFLINIGVLDEDKNITELGIKLGKAYDISFKEEIINIWSSIINDNLFLNNLINSLKISGKSYEFEDYKKKILSDSNDNVNSHTKSGCAAIIEIFELCNLILINNGIISYNQKYNELNDMKEKIDKLEKLKTDKLEKLGEEISDANNNEINNLIEEIEDLNKDIKNYKLSDDFYKKSLRLQNESKSYSFKFFLMICADIVLIIVLYFMNRKFFNDPNIVFNIKLGLLSFGILGLSFWGTKYFNRRTHESIQLAEDYEHKALVLSLFGSYSKELNKLDREDKQLLLDYVSKVSTTINKSPATNLSKRKPDSTPVEDLTELLLNISNLVKK